MDLSFEDEEIKMDHTYKEKHNFLTLDALPKQYSKDGKYLKLKNQTVLDFIGI